MEGRELEVVTSASSNPNIVNNDRKRDIPLVLFPYTINGLLNKIEKTQAWKESVKIKSAS